MLTLQKQLFVQKILDKPPNQVVKTQNNKNIGNEAYTKTPTKRPLHHQDLIGFICNFEKTKSSSFILSIHLSHFDAKLILFL